MEKKEFSSMFPDIPPFSVASYSIEELTSQKSTACLDRSEIRDIYCLDRSEMRDIYDLHMLSKQKMSIEKIQTFATIYFCMSANNSKPDISKIKDFDIKKIQQELHQFMRNSEKLKYLHLTSPNKNLLTFFLTRRKYSLN